MPLDNRACSHLRKLNQITSRLCHEGQPLDSFTSDYRKVPFFNWNPPAQDTLVASCKNDIDDHVKIDGFVLVTPSLKTTLTVACHLMMETYR